MIRKIDSKSAVTNRSRIPSAKNGCLVRVESMLERDMALRLEMSPLVISYKEQAGPFHFEHLGKPVKAIPDFEIVFADGSIEYIEVKPWQKASSESRASKLRATKVHLHELGYKYEVMTEREIRSCNQLLQNCMYLNPFKWRSRNRTEELFDLVPDQETTIESLGKSIDNPQAVIELISHQFVYCDLYQRITMDSRIRPVTDGDYWSLYI